MIGCRVLKERAPQTDPQTMPCSSNPPWRRAAIAALSLAAASAVMLVTAVGAPAVAAAPAPRLPHHSKAGLCAAYAAGAQRLGRVGTRYSAGYCRAHYVRASMWESATLCIQDDGRRSQASFDHCYVTSVRRYGALPHNPYVTPSAGDLRNLTETSGGSSPQSA